MATTYVLGAEPFWILINLQGTLAGGGKLYTRRSLDIDTDKPTFQDAGGQTPNSNPIIFDGNGVAHTPIFFQVDSAAPDDTYYLQATDADGNVLWTDRDYVPGAGGGGGGNTTTYIPIINYISNNQFIDHIDDTAIPIDPAVATNLVIAPSNHKGFTPALLAPVVGTYGVVGPDIRFIKNNTTAVDQITFPLFPLASAPMGPGDITPVDYIRYVSNAAAGESYKCFQFPITQKVKNLSNQRMTFTMWAAVTLTPVTLNVYTRQYYGSDPTATAESGSTRQLAGSMVLTTTWKLFQFSFTVPNVSGNSIGTPGAQTDDDALYIQVEMPIQTACDVLFTKPSLYLGDINAQIDFESYDQINSINSTPRTGDIKTSLSSSAPRGWVAMNDGTIGNVGSGATRANKDTFQLYKTIWDGVLDAWAPVSNPAGRGATAIADFLIGKRLKLPLSLGRAMAGAGSGFGLTARVLGESLGNETVTLLGTNLPIGTPFATGLLGNDTVVTGLAITNVPSSLSAFTQGAGVPAAIMQPTSFMNVFIKL